IKALTERTLVDNRRFFGPDEVQPKLAITMGLGTILDARRVVLLATGQNKADAVAAMVEGPLTAMCPASVLQLHNAATILIDREAASRLHPDHRRYFQWVAEEQEAITDRFGDVRERG